MDYLNSMYSRQCNSVYYPFSEPGQIPCRICKGNPGHSGVTLGMGNRAVRSPTFQYPRVSLGLAGTWVPGYPLTALMGKPSQIPVWARNGQTGLARSNPIWAPYRLAIWVKNGVVPLLLLNMSLYLLDSVGIFLDYI